MVVQNGVYPIIGLKKYAINNLIMTILIFFLLHWYLSLFAQSVFLHRYVSHGMFKMNPFWEKTFFLFTFFAQGSSFLNPAAYGIMHRKHHAHSDTQKDPHSPIHTNNVFAFNLKTLTFGWKYNQELGESLDNLTNLQTLEFLIKFLSSSSSEISFKLSIISLSNM